MRDVDRGPFQETPATASVLTRVVARLLFLPALVVAVAILVRGYAAPGDGFSAGVVASLGVVLQYLALGRREAESLPLVRGAGRLAFAGLLVGLALAAGPLFLGEPVLYNYPGPGGEVVYLGTLEIITAVAFDVGIALLVFGFVVGSVGVISRATAVEEEYRGRGDGAEEELEEETSKETFKETSGEEMSKESSS